MGSGPLPEQLALGPFRVAEAAALGLGQRRLAADDLEAPFHGLRSPARVRALHDRCGCLLPALRPHALFSHATAAALWGLPLPKGAADGDLHVVGPVGERRRRAGVATHAQTADSTGAFVRGLPVVRPAWAWAQCSEQLTLDELVVMGDALVGRWSPHPAARELPLEALDTVVRAWSGRRGARLLRDARALVRTRVWSPKETELRLLIVRAGLPEPPERNAPVTDAAGRVLGHADLAYREQKIALEYEGDGHRSSRTQWRRDIGRYESFHDAGWRVVRVTDDDLVTPRILVARMARHLGIEALPWTQT
jgi:hypothetical protein